MARRKRPAISPTGLNTTTSIGPASTPQINHHPPLFQPEHLFPLLKPSPANAQLDQRARRRRSAGSDLGEAESATAASKEGDDDDDEEDQVVWQQGMYWWGLALVTFSTLCFIMGVWSMAVGPFVDTEHVWILDALAKDTHYKYLLVFLVPVTLYAVIINWWGLKIFRHA